MKSECEYALPACQLDTSSPAGCIFFFFLDSLREWTLPRESRWLGKVLAGILCWVFPTSYSFFVSCPSGSRDRPLSRTWGHNILLSTWVKYPLTELSETISQENNFSFKLFLSCVLSFWWDKSLRLTYEYLELERWEKSNPWTEPDRDSRTFGKVLNMDRA